MDALNGIKVIELPGLAPVPYCAQLLAHFGANVTFVEKKGSSRTPVERQLMEGKTIVALDFEADKLKLRELILNADVLLDPYRPGVLEAIKLDPVGLLEENKSLIVARVTGYGQTGRLRHVAGHDINYTALSGVLPILSGPNRPLWPPINLLADFAGGGLSCAFAICAALIKRNTTGLGAVIDVSMTEGVSYLANYVFNYQERETFWDPENGFFSGRFPVYRTYETKDKKFVAVGALEPKFHNKLFEVLQIDPFDYSYSELAKKMEKIFRTKTRDEWQKMFDGTDACVTPVLSIDEVGDYHRDRDSFFKVNGKWRPRPSPRIYTKEEFARLLRSQSKL
ncbi:Alpha-methylacyl-CoA racemase [Aphelenchoides besseyi]|nr:Alpha-methylacyl-CoA racemase [Aphelenchoides besseyi]